MQHNIRRNKKIFEYLSLQAKRVIPDIKLTAVFLEFIFLDLSVKDSKEIIAYFENTRGQIAEDILDNESALNETIKFIGLLEVSNNEAELRALINRRKEIKHGKPLTDFDKILKAIMTVPNTAKQIPEGNKEKSE